MVEPLPKERYDQMKKVVKQINNIVDTSVQDLWDVIKHNDKPYPSKRTMTTIIRRRLFTASKNFTQE